jgi:hypothetical protein
MYLDGKLVLVEKAERRVPYAFLERLFAAYLPPEESRPPSREWATFPRHSYCGFLVVVGFELRRGVQRA